MNYDCHVRNMTAAANPMTATVIQPTILVFFPLVLPSRIFLSFPIFIITTRSGTAITPLITAVYIRALIGSIFAKFIQSPTTVDAVYNQVKSFGISEFFTKALLPSKLLG